MRVRGLVKAYGGHRAVDGIDLDIRAGEIFALLGPNGAGKTTTVEILEGFRSRGRRRGHRCSGHDPAERDRAWRARVGIVLQSTGEAGELTVAELVRHFAGFYPRPRDPDEVIEAVGLTEQGRARGPARCPAASGGGSTSRSASSATRSCCSWTSRRPASTRRPGGRSGSC